MQSSARAIELFCYEVSESKRSGEEARHVLGRPLSHCQAILELKAEVAFDR
jgi:hypothetical protein